ncbi:double-strand break repair helicase AddA [Sinisalibacter lacisalsi]|uniref:DNA 3'-5' helicase n=1 Tax=Sinisalibacter lacisalsi TaxID=1526570 RepID=A0ABQ1QBH9_9RHOB|nr:double-strand break repair helicase AddA [Sinisalibacter lacisalsi]GGD21290.1 double-strand break repair helicase AddA [Sinisalibacter lacisalsi]
MTPNDATLRQIEAADPLANTWLKANAGSGKTRVLTDRVARLLLSGVSPQNILCLTYTKAAASEMQNRLFARLGGWSMKPDDALREELRELGVEDASDLAKARRLFAGAIETPGGLKIQTIHSFCASILRRFPLEAGVSPQFAEMDDRTARQLQAEALDEMASGPEQNLIGALAAHVTDADFTRLANEILNRRAAFETETDEAEIWRWFNLPKGFDEAALFDSVFAPGDGQLIADILPFFLAGTSTDKKNAEKLAAVNIASPSVRDLEVLEGVFLTGAGAKEPFSAKIGSVPTKATQKAAAHLMPRLDALMHRVEASRELRVALGSARKTKALHAFAHPFLTRYEASKQARGWLDFDDLITRAGRLLNHPGLAAWVLYRLDGGIDHILVDEAQDTSPAQWRVIESLAREFTAGESARSEKPRTLFVVGDLKQSIYSFQGADPTGFTRMQEQFEGAFRQVGAEVRGMELEYSFRSSWAILSMVDHTLEAAPGLGREIKHRTLDLDRPGRVDLWPVVEGQDSEADPPWNHPVDVPAPDAPAVVLANAVADAISDMLESGSIPAKDGGMRAIRAGDVMVLVRRRSELFHQIIRACKARGLPIAGADRLRIGGELAVKDLTAVLAFLATPEDDLSLAAALRSPLFGLTEDDLFRLAHGRGGRFLWNQLRGSGEAHGETIEILNDLRGQADYLRPYDLIDRILTRHDGRQRLVARLGAEAEDGIDALLVQALAYERVEVPSLTGFLTWLASDDVEIKRQLDSAGDQIRVMTVHGAKGLEAPVVILPETAKRRAPNRDRLIETASGVCWRLGDNDAPQVIREAVNEAKSRDEEESMRLLYVAMTRAESWLVIAGAGDVGAADSAESWYRIAEAGMRCAGAVAEDFALGSGLRYEIGDWGAGATEEEPTVGQPRPWSPDWLHTHATLPAPPPAALRPSELGGAKVIGSEQIDEDMQEAALRHGRQVHRLLEFLPAYDRASWGDVARELLAFGEDAATPEEAAFLLEEVRAVLDAPDLKPLFGANALAEVEISAPVSRAEAERVHGVIDRLIIGPDRVLAVDFKTNRIVPEQVEDIPEGLLRQMGAYEAALAAIYPGRAIASALLWTRTAQLMLLPEGLALRAFGRLDGSRPRS